MRFRWILCRNDSIDETRKTLGKKSKYMTGPIKKANISHEGLEA